MLEPAADDSCRWSPSGRARASCAPSEAWQLRGSGGGDDCGGGGNGGGGGGGAGSANCRGSGKTVADPGSEKSIAASSAAAAAASSFRSACQGKGGTWYGVGVISPSGNHLPPMAAWCDFRAVQWQPCTQSALRMTEPGFWIHSPLLLFLTFCHRATRASNRTP